ncbi:hypothetical protein RWE15_16690 [Virgibacillus halophilus]|uniref:Uncharacterized protein n=1 Tax=Tigheibacillus halophilus TaxID=361280 RepID=A0ABU5C945_9BACI|nr:hypothetical protein [Virgibacillus halophilus]
MIQLQLLQKIGVLAISVLLGYAYYFFMSEEKKQFKWKNGNLLVSQLMNFIICLWISKVLIHVRTFFHDPLAVLAYPSDAKAFYMANGLMLMYILWLSGRKKWQTMSFMPVFVPAFFGCFFYI